MHDQSSSTSKRRARRVRALRAVEFAGVVIATVVYPAIVGLDPRSRDAPTAIALLVELPWLAGMTAIVIALLLRIPGHPLRPREEWTSWRQQVLLIVPLLLGTLTIGTVLRSLLGGLGLTGGPTVWEGALEDRSVVAMFVLTAPVAAFYEEIVFRAYLLTRLTAWVGSAPALLISASCFAATHASYPPLEVVTTFFVGLLLGAGWVGTRSLIAVAGAHCTYNLLIVLG